MSGFTIQPGFAQPFSMGAPLYANENAGPVELFPNPDFVFPARPEPLAQSAHNPHPVNRRPRSHQNLSGSLNVPAPRASASVSALPSFSFNPAAEPPTSPLSTPPHSPSFNTPSTPSRGTRHRRGGSEFIGGDHKTGSVSIINNSPGRPDFTAQQPSHLGPPQGRRHAHRRSGAISCHDLASILQPRDVNTQLRSGSAPTSPYDLDNAKSFFAVGQRRSSDQSLQDVAIEESIETETTPQHRPQSRARVGFAERVEYIRPLSTISSETESSMSTIRGHSVTGSCSSVLSAGPTSPSPARRARPSLNTTFEDEQVQPRPHTSQAFFGSPVEGHFSSSASRFRTDERPRSEAGLPRSSPITGLQPKRKSFGWWDSKQKQSTSPQLLASSPNASDHLLSPPSPNSPHSRKSLESDQETVTNVRACVDSRKPRKVRSWAHSLISRKHKGKKDSRRPATPPARSLPSDTDDSDSTDSQPDPEHENIEFNFDEDNTVTIINETVQPVTPRQDVFPLRPVSQSADPDIQSPVIDLDVALDPLGSPVDGQPGLKQPRTRRSMHSASLTSGAFALGAQHRRTESAPELMPFESRNAKFTQQSAMPDVFEEEDEELAAEEFEKRADSAVTAPTSSFDDKEDQQEESIGIHVVEVDEAAVAAGPWPIVSGFGSNRRKKSEGLSIDTGSRPSSMVYDPPEKLQLPLAPQPSVAVEVVEDHEEVRDSKSSDETITPPPTADKTPDSNGQFRYALPLPPQHIMTPDTISDTSLYSPFFSPSQASLDTPRLDTAPSSITDSRSFSFGEPGPEVRMSSDDVPSLTSSRSTMTSPAIYPMLPSASTGRTSSVYSVHSTATAELARRKRGSIASLSRLVAGSFGERSKLSIETRPMSQHMPVEPKKVKSRHRLSKLMQFWKSKEDRPTSNV